MSIGPDRIYLSSGAVATRAIGELLNICQQAQIKYLELASGLPCDRRGFDQLELAAEHDGFSYLVHNYFPAPGEPFVLNLAAQNIEELARSIAHCKNAIDVCRKLNVPFFSVHSGFALPVETSDLGNPEAWLKRTKDMNIDLDAAMDVFSSTVRDLADYASDCGVRLLLENNVVSPKLTNEGAAHHGLLLCEGIEIADFFKSLKHPNVGLLVDVGHAKVSASALGFNVKEFIENVADYVEAFHLSDNDGTADTNMAFTQDAWFAPFLNSFPGAYLVIEVYRMSVNEIRGQHTVLQDILS